jgi:hypothetical protein
MAVSFGGWVTGLLWLVVGNPWVAVAIVAAVLGVYLLENGELQARAGAARAEVSELEKQIVGLRTWPNGRIIGFWCWRRGFESRCGQYWFLSGAARVRARRGGYNFLAILALYMARLGCC